jgi:hypothetical protein
MQRDPACAATHIEDRATDVLHGAPLMGGPLLEGSEVRWSSRRYVKPAVIAFNDFDRRQALIVSVYEAAVRVFLQGQHSVLIGHINASR